MTGDSICRRRGAAKSSATDGPWRSAAHPCLLLSSARPRPPRRLPTTMSMFDPLSVPNFPQDEPPWPTKPHSPSDPIPNLPRPSSRHEPRGPPAGLYGKEPQIYGQPEPALISPRLNPGSNGTQFERKEPYLRVRITTLDRNRRDVLIKFDAQVRTSAPTDCFLFSMFLRISCRTTIHSP